MPVEVTDDSIRIRIKDPDLFIPASFRTIVIGAATKGIKAVIGKLKADKPPQKTTVQTYIFDKKKWTVATAQAWVDENKSLEEELLKDVKDDDMKPEKFIEGEVKKIKEHTYRFIASDERIDRDGDILRVGGWDLKNYRKNPMILYGHGRQSSIPIGKGVATKDLESKRLYVDIEFIPREMYPFAGLIEDLVEKRFIKTGSVQFLPTEKRDMKPEMYPPKYKGRIGTEFLKQELLEFSPVPIPSNVGAVALGMEEKDYISCTEQDCKELVEDWLKEQDTEGESILIVKCAGCETEFDFNKQPLEGKDLAICPECDGFVDREGRCYTVAEEEKPESDEVTVEDLLEKAKEEENIDVVKWLEENQKKEE